MDYVLPEVGEVSILRVRNQYGGAQLDVFMLVRRSQHTRSGTSPS